MKIMLSNTEREEYIKTLKEIIDELEGVIDNETIWMRGSESYEEIDYHTMNLTKYISLKNDTLIIHQIINSNNMGFNESHISILDKLIEMYEEIPEEKEKVNILHSIKEKIERQIDEIKTNLIERKDN